MGIDKKLVAFIKDEMVHNTKPEVAFSTKGFSILNNVFKALHEEEQNSFFKSTRHPQNLFDYGSVLLSTL